MNDFCKHEEAIKERTKNMIFVIGVVLIIIIMIVTDKLDVGNRTFAWIILVATAVMLISALTVMKMGNDVIKHLKDEREILVADYYIANDKTKVLNEIEKHNELCSEQSNSIINNAWFNINVMFGLDFDKYKIDVDNLNVGSEEQTLIKETTEEATYQQMIIDGTRYNLVPEPQP